MESLNLNGLIKDVLLENNYVVIPAFGAFVTNYQPASIDYDKKQILPPNRVVSFNAQITNDDGILVSYLSQNKHIDYSDAKNIIDKWVKNAFRVLEDGRSVKVDKVGAFIYNDDLKLEFTPEKPLSLNLHTYGMTSVPCHRVKKAQTIPLKKASSSTKLWLRAAALIPLFIFAFALSYYLVGTTSFKQTQQSMASFFDYSLKSLNTIEWSKKTEHLTKKTQPKENKANNNIIPKIEVKTPENKNVEKYNNLKKETNLQAKSKIKTPKRTIERKYWLIGGCFSNKKNAEKLVNQLSRDYHHILVVPYKNMFRVILEKYETKDQAVESMKKLKSKQISTWVYTHP